MEIFQAITSNPLLAVGVQELIYDARLFPAYASFDDDYEATYEGTSDSEDEDAYEDLDDEEYEFRCSESRERQCSKLRQEQQQILDLGAEFEYLSTGLRNLPNLKVVSVLECFHPGYRLGSGLMAIRAVDEFKWYNDLSRKLWKHVNPPAPLSDFEGLLDAQVWDARGIRSLLRSVSMRSPLLTHFHYGSGAWALPLKLLSAEGACFHVHDLLPSLTCLRIVCDSGGKCSEALSESEAVRHRSAFAESIKLAKNLRVLSLYVHHRYGHRFNLGWDDMFSDASWPCLTSLELGDWSLSPDALIAVCHRHRDTLRHLSLQHTFLEPSAIPRTWEEVGEELGQFLRLHSVWANSLLSDAPEGFLGGLSLSSARMNVIMQSVMQWIPSQFLKLCSGGMWYTTKFTPSALRGSNHPDCGCLI